jgi:hypothetical protein
MTRLSRGAALGLMIASLAAPAASARPSLQPPESRSFASPDAQDRARAAESRPYQDLRSPDTRDYAAGRGTFSAPEVTVVRVPETAPSTPAAGLDWGDALIGAGFAVALGLIGVGGAMIVTRRTPASRSVTSRTA